MCVCVDIHSSQQTSVPCGNMPGLEQNLHNQGLLFLLENVIGTWNCGFGVLMCFH